MAKIEASTRAESPDNLAAAREEAIVREQTRCMLDRYEDRDRERSSRPPSHEDDEEEPSHSAASSFQRHSRWSSEVGAPVGIAPEPVGSHGAGARALARAGQARPRAAFPTELDSLHGNYSSPESHHASPKTRHRSRVTIEGASPNGGLGFNL